VIKFYSKLSSCRGPQDLPFRVTDQRSTTKTQTPRSPICAQCTHLTLTCSLGQTATNCRYSLFPSRVEQSGVINDFRRTWQVPSLRQPQLATRTVFHPVFSQSEFPFKLTSCVVCRINVNDPTLISLVNKLQDVFTTVGVS
jgi:hypothetical protein